MGAQKMTPIVQGGASLYPPEASFWGGWKPEISNAETQTYEPGLEPTNNGDGSWTYTLPAVEQPLNTRRIERFWAVDGRECFYKRPDTLVFEGDFMGVLGAAAASDNQWHLLWQSHGPGGTDLNNWRPPPFGITVRNGKIRISGGEGHPNNQFTAAGYYGWKFDLGPWQDNVKHHIRVENHIGNDPDGWISCWFDGLEICRQWRPLGYWPNTPPGPTGNNPGTIFSTPDQEVGDWLVSRSGLYRGAQNGEAPPTYEQWIRWWPTYLSPAHQP